MKTLLIIISLLLSGFGAVVAQQSFLTLETYRDKVEAYSQVLKQQQLTTMASADARRVAYTGFLPKIDINIDGTLNMNDLESWNEPEGEYRNHTYQGIFVVAQPLYTGGILRARHQIAKADEQLSRLNEELTLGSNTLSKRCYLLDCFGLLCNEESRREISGYCQAAIRYHSGPLQ